MTEAHPAVFLGTAEFAVPALRALHRSPAFHLSAVVSRPPRPAGRGRKLRQPPVAAEARRLGLPLLQPKRADGGDFLADIRAIGPKVMVCAAYGLYMPEELLDAAEMGVVNVHPSMLPRHRGAAPIQRAIMQGDDSTALCFMLTDSEGWDTGPILRCYPCRLSPRETAGSLHDRLAGLAGEKLEEVLTGYVSGGITPTPQEGEPSYADRIGRDETMIDWSRPAVELDRLVRALSPLPGARTAFRGGWLKVLMADPLEGNWGAPGSVRENGGGFPAVGCGVGGLLLRRVQPQSKRRMDGDDFLRGYQPGPGERLGEDAGTKGSSP